jgi:hypothetical protein
MRHRQPKGSETDRPVLNHRVTSRLYTFGVVTPTSRLTAAGKDQRKITTAVARELLGFIWAIGTKAETIVRQRAAA